MVHLSAVMIQIRALAKAGEPRDEVMARRLALRATKWIADVDVGIALGHELTVALSANAMFAELNDGAVQQTALADVESALARIEAASRVN